jgi:tripartite-type tricarboxylate transporter receptor subunit TctC
MANELFESVACIKLNDIVFRGGAEVTLAPLGGHVEAPWLNPSEAIDHYAVKKIRPLGVTSRARLTGMPEAPTFKDEGFDAVFDNHFRGVTAPAGMPTRRRPTLSTS